MLYVGILSPINNLPRICNNDDTIAKNIFIVTHDITRNEKLANEKKNCKKVTKIKHLKMIKSKERGSYFMQSGYR